MFADIQHFVMLDQGGHDGSIYFGGTFIDATYTGTKLGDNFDAPVGYGTAAEGAYNGYAAINAPWSDTTNFDNLRGDGSAEVISANVKHTNSTQPATYGHSS